MRPRGKQVNLDVAWWARRVLSIYFLRQRANSKSVDSMKALTQVNAQALHAYLR